MVRTLILGASLALLCGCNASRKTVTTGSTNSTVQTAADPKPADEPKQYDYHDLSRGDSAFRRK